MSIMLNGTENALVAGTITPGDVLTITVEDASLAGGQEPVSYTVQAGDNFKAVATGLAAAVNANANLQAIGVKALAYGRVVSLTSLSTKETSYSKSFSPGATENIFFSTSINGVLTAVIGGTVTAADVLTVTVFDRGISSGSRAVSYTVQAGDSLDTIASSLAAAINAENALSNEGISASSVGPVLNILSRSRNLTTASQSVSPGATETIAMSPAANVTGYGYNNVNELTSISPGGNAYFQGTTNKAVKSVTVGSVPATLDSTRDFSASDPLSQGANDIPVTAIDGGNNSRTENFQIPIRGQQSAALTFDANGNMTSNGTGQTYEWDAENRLIKINYVGTGKNSQFTFDPTGRNVKIVEVSGGTTTSTKDFIWCADERCEERNDSGSVLFLSLGQKNDGTSYFYARDHLWSTRGMTDDSALPVAQYEFGPFGRAVEFQTSQPSDFQYAGYYHHSRSGLSFSLTRAYNPNLGSWLSRDSLEEVEGTNLHAYVDNNPISYFDPSGQAKKGGGRVKTLICLLLLGACLKCNADACELFWNFCVDDCGKKNKGRSGKQRRLKELGNDPKVSSRDRGWIQQEQNQIARGSRSSIRVPPGKVMAHERGREASKGYGYEHSHLQDKDLHDTQHKYDDKGRANKERPLMPKWCK